GGRLGVSRQAGPAPRGRRDHAPAAQRIAAASPLVPLRRSRYTRGMFDSAVFAARRDAYMQAIGPGGVAVVRSLPERLRNGDSHYPFRQLSDLVYLTGFVEPETTL